jgi:Holliday junction DNA helicase RuvA
MIGRLSGEIISKKPPQILIDVNGVGYEVEAPMSTFYELPDAGNKVVLLTHMVVREDAQLLYGFASESERTMFRLLIRINGVGPKLGITILSGIASTELARCVADNDVSTLVKLPGIGKKTAERLVIELKDRLKNLAPAKSGDSTEEVHILSSQESPMEDAISALITLGYKSQEASRMVKNVKAENVSSEDLIRLALQSMAVNN